MAVPLILIPMSDYGHDPTETSVPYNAFKEAGFEVHFATENGNPPECDKKMLRGVTQKLLGASAKVVKLYDAMAKAAEFQKPLSWSSPDFSLEPYTLVFLPGGHEKGVRQLIDSPIMAKHLASYFPQTIKPSKKAVAAVCHGVMALAAAKYEEGPEKGKSVMHEVETTALPGTFEEGIFWATRLFLGDYYKTYGAGSEPVQTSVSKVLDDPKKQYKNSLASGNFVVEDKKYNYISARFPGDVDLLAEKTVALIKAIARDL